MNDMEILRDAWTDTEPPSPTARADARAALLDRAAAAQPAARAAATDEPARVALSERPAVAVTDEIGKPVGPARAARRNWTIGLTAVGVAATVVIGFAVAPSLNRGEHFAAQPTTVRGVLERAAYEAKRRPYTAPRPGQWFVVERRRLVGTRQSSRGFALPGPYATVSDQAWFSLSGVTYWDAPRKPYVVEGRYETPPQALAYKKLAALPTDPARLIAWSIARVPRGSGGGIAWDQVVEDLNWLLMFNGAPPKVQAVIYRALSRIPGARITTGITGGLGGRTAVAVGWLCENAVYKQLLFDSSTYAYLGWRQLNGPRPVPGDGSVEGTLMFVDFRVRAAYVDHGPPGSQP